MRQWGRPGPSQRVLLLGSRDGLDPVRLRHLPKIRSCQPLVMLRLDEVPLLRSSVWTGPWTTTPPSCGRTQLPSSGSGPVLTDRDSRLCLCH